MMKTYMSGFAIDEEAADAEVPSDEDMRAKGEHDYMVLNTERQKRPVSAMRAVNHNMETELIDGTSQ